MSATIHGGGGAKAFELISSHYRYIEYSNVSQVC